MSVKVLEYYAKPEVKREIAKYCRGRWVAVHCECQTEDGRPILLRYYRGKPLTISKPEDVDFILNKFEKLKPRAFYATANLYRKITLKEDVFDYTGNVYARTPSWDIDSKLEWWRATLKVAKALIRILEEHGVKESVYLKWSGRGVHVHVHEKAISEKLYSKIPPLDLTYSLVEYVVRKVQRAVGEVNLEEDTSIKVENLMDPQRVFTAPLSLHRFLYVSCIIFPPEDIDDFDISWTDPRSYRHKRAWEYFKEGEADELALKAIEIIGGYPRPVSTRRKRKTPIEAQIRKYLPNEETFHETKAKRKYRPEDLRLNFNPPPISGGRNFAKGPREAFLKVEDILSHYALGNITLEHALKALRYALHAILPLQKYSEEDLLNLKMLYKEAIEILEKLKSPHRVKEWLLSHGPPKTIKKLDEFF